MSNIHVVLLNEEAMNVTLIISYPADTLLRSSKYKLAIAVLKVIVRVYVQSEHKSFIDSTLFEEGIQRNSLVLTLFSSAFYAKQATILVLGVKILLHIL